MLLLTSMSSTRVLRSHTAAGVTLSRPPTPAQHRATLPGGQPEIAEATVRLYSNIVASRPASPRGETLNRDPASGPENLTKVVTHWESPDEFSEREIPFMTITKSRRALSLDSPQRKRGMSNPSTSTAVHEQVIQLATDALTTEERAQIQRRMNIVDAQERTRLESPRGKQ